jgi:hypothetical protein
MGALTDLNLNTRDGAIMCVAAPDSVLAEAAAMKPRPSFASTLLTAEPTARLLWWPELQHLEQQTLTRLKWLIETAAGEAWLILDSAEPESPKESATTESLAEVGLNVATSTRLGRNEIALSIGLTQSLP